MARLPRLYRVVGTYPDGKVKRRNYLSPEAAADRVTHLEEQGARATTEASYPVSWPAPLDTRLDIPDSTISRDAWNDLAERVGIAPQAVLSITTTGTELVVEYDPDLKRPGKRAPQTWRVYIEEN